MQLRVTEAGDRGAPVVVLAHGFPELAYSGGTRSGAGRGRLPRAGARPARLRRVVEPDAVEAYNIVELTGDIVGLLDDVGAERAVFVGHDCGAVVRGTPLLHPDRVAGVVGVSVPPVPRPRVPTDQAFRKVFGDNFFYILYFQEPGPADAELDARPATTLRRLLGARSSDDEAARCGCSPRARRASSTGCPNPAALPDWIEPGRVRPLRRGVHPHRIHRPAELVPQLRPQLGADRDHAGRHHRRADAVHRRAAADPTLAFTPARPGRAKSSPATTAR